MLFCVKIHHPSGQKNIKKLAWMKVTCDDGVIKNGDHNIYGDDSIDNDDNGHKQ